jgi:hypothetical protein
MNDRSCRKVSNRILTASSLAYFGESMIGSLRGVLSGERVEGGDVEDVSGRERVVTVGGGIRRIVGPVRVGEIAHRKEVM